MSQIFCIFTSFLGKYCTKLFEIFYVLTREIPSLMLSLRRFLVVLVIQKITSLYTERCYCICQDPHQVSPNFRGRIQCFQLFKKKKIFFIAQVTDVLLSVWRKCEDTQLQPSISLQIGNTVTHKPDRFGREV